MNKNTAQLASLAILALPFVGLKLVAQTSPTPDADQSVPSKTASVPVMMSSFEVSSTQDTGYIDKNAATAFKTDEALITIPQPVMVVTRDMITDIGYNISSQVLQYAGVVPVAMGEDYSLRGSRVSYDLVDELPDIIFYQDNFYLDSYEIVKGPAAVFYPSAALGGIILKTTRKPMDTAQGFVDYSHDVFGLQKAELDTTGPIMKLGDGIFAYRVDTDYQDGKTYFNNQPDQIEAITPSLQWHDHNTRVLMAFDLQNLLYIAGEGSGLASPDGGVYSGMGRSNEYNIPAGANEVYRYTAWRMQIEHNISDNWSMSTHVMIAENRFRGVANYAGSVDWTTLTADWTDFYEDNRYREYAFMNDYIGKYRLFGPIMAQTTTGINFEKVDNQYLDLNPPASQQNAWNNYSLNEPVQNFIHLVPLSQWTINSAAPYTGTPDGNSNDLVQFDAYYQEEVNVWPDRLSLVAGLTWRYIQTDSLQPSYTSLAAPYVTDESVLSSGLYRVGAVFQIIPKQVALYTMTSTYAASNGSAEDAQGNVLPPKQGKGSEVGLKTDLLDGRFTSTVSVYRIALSNVAEFVGYTSVGTQSNQVFEDIGGTVQKGWDMDVGFKVVRGLQLVGTFYKGTVLSSPTNQPVAQTYTGEWSIFGKYDFDKTTFLKGLSLGGGASEVLGRVIGAGGMNFSPAQQAQLVDGLIQQKDAVQADCFADYHFARHYDVRLSLTNILNKNYIQGDFAGTLVDPSVPRDLTCKLVYSW